MYMHVWMRTIVVWHHNQQNAGTQLTKLMFHRSKLYHNILLVQLLKLRKVTAPQSTIPGMFA